MLFHLSVCLPAFLTVCVVCLPVCLLVLSACLSVCLLVLSACLSVCLCCLLACLSVCLCCLLACLSVCLCCLLACLSVCLCCLLACLFSLCLNFVFSRSAWLPVLAFVWHTDVLAFILSGSHMCTPWNIPLVRLRCYRMTRKKKKKKKNHYFETLTVIPLSVTLTVFSRSWWCHANQNDSFYVYMYKTLSFWCA